MKKKIGFAIVGLGSLSQYQIIPAFLESKKCKLVGLVSRDSQKVKIWAEKYGILDRNTYTYDNFDSISRNSDIDVVYIVLPNSMHADFTIRAARADKHVLCEKPMANSLLDCKKMIAVCRENKKQLGIAYRLRFEPHHQEMIRLAREEVFGKIKIIEANFSFCLNDNYDQWRLKKELSGGGALMDVGIYALEAARYITGEEPVIVSVQAFKATEKFKEVEETIFFQLQFPSGIVANCGASYSGYINRLHVVAEKGWFKLEPAFTYNDIQGQSSNGKIVFPEINQFVAEMDNFAECLLSNKPVSISGEEGLRDIKLIQDIYNKI